MKPWSPWAVETRGWTRRPLVHRWKGSHPTTRSRVALCGVARDKLAGGAGATSGGSLEMEAGDAWGRGRAGWRRF